MNFEKANSGTPESPSGEDDLGLVERTLAGEKQAFEALVRRYEKRVFRVTVAVAGNLEDAEEAMQDAFILAYRHLGQFRGESRFSTWLTRIAVNAALQKRQSRKEAVSLDDPSVSEVEIVPHRLERWHDDPETICGKREMKQIVEQAIQSLPALYREAFVMRDVEGLTTQEAAETLGIGVPALKSRLLRARLMMREALAERFARPKTLGSMLGRAGWMVRGAMIMALGRLKREK